MISAKKLIKIVQKWQKLTALQQNRISLPGGSDGCTLHKGHFAIYTADQRRFVVPLAYLNNPIFRQLLKMSEEEYGLPNGPIVLPCDSIFVGFVISLIQQGQAGDLYEALLKSVARSCCSLPCLYEGPMNQHLIIH